MPVVTLAEIDATARKAARGHGCPWGLAEEAGKSTRWLASHGLPGVEALADMLRERAQCCTVSGPPCALRLCAAMADRVGMSGEEPVGGDMAGHPLLVLAQMGRTADALDRSFALEWEEGSATVSRHAVSIGGTFAASSMVCSPTADTGGECIPLPGSRPVEERAWVALRDLSHRTLVPASAASRTGAGAGTSDND